MSMYKFVQKDILGIQENSFIVDLLLDAILIYLGISAFNKNTNHQKILSLLVIAFSILGFAYNSTDIITYLNGLRELLIIPAVILFLEAVKKSPLVLFFFKEVKRFIFFFLALQIPCALYQFSQYGASDKVGGSLGAYSSGILTLTIFISLFFLTLFNSTFYTKSRFKALLPLTVFLLPVVLNETKITFIIIPIFILCVIQVKNFRSIISISIGCLILIGAVSSLYSDGTKKINNPIKEIFNKDFLEKYLTNEVEKGEDVPRFTKIAFASKLISEDSGNFLLGMEYGAFKGGTFLKTSPFAQKYNWLLLGSRPYIFYLLITGGLLLSLLILYQINKVLYAQFLNIKLNNFQTLFLRFIIIIIMLYNDAFRDRFFISIFFTIQILLTVLNWYEMRKIQYCQKIKVHLYE
ncbi:hypothetical protein [Solitalea lacus]|uniref:hypothetical protein n=1 Tax=Solitalea lacus TaxID=2911172 RepID=UPI001EDA3253|nr:hypothetical protein [Solitalea lacus]UKJ07072.1 hypothetical protein L2B55_16270 [Solitalea lacus]